ncbi:hypothetical protein BGZ70_000409 [Mortierella alpina]|uniref:Uncharacterized protein n=1 Tax=Mortierella alpina TaxID=64518 RepID=A0A9P6IYD0_MORAP|nr:hypothetical protein BGZ70_000409 [Mortierella alpina]
MKMLRLGRRGIVLSLFINSLNVVLYLIIFIAACLNMTEASVNFIILNAFAASFACLLIISEIRLPQLTYEYFRFLCTYRGRGLTYMFFGCLIASRIPFNLYGGIIVVCMGMAFFMLSYVTLIPPLDGFILNCKKLDEWKEQKHFRVQLEAQRIFEQQLQQEQTLTRMMAVHHPNGHTVHAQMSTGSPKQPRPSSTISSGSTQFTNTGNGAGPSAGILTDMFSPPISPTRQTGNHPLLAMLLPKHATHEPQFPHHQLQSKLQGSTNNLNGPPDASTDRGNRDHSAIGRGKGRLLQERALHDEAPKTAVNMQERSQPLQKDLKKPLRLDKSLPPISTSGLEGIHQFSLPVTFMLSPPPTRRPSATHSDPGSPLQYLNVGNDDPLDSTEPVVNAFPGGKMEWHTESDDDDDGALRSTLAYAQGQAPHEPLKSDLLPLRVNNKPAPPHDPFRRASLSSKNPAGTLSAAQTMMTKTSPASRVSMVQHQSLYHPPEPPQQSDGRVRHPVQPQPERHSYHPLDHVARPSKGLADALPLTATGRILSSIGGMAGCYSLGGALLPPLKTPSAAPEDFCYETVDLECSDQRVYSTADRGPKTVQKPAASLSSSAPPTQPQPHQHQQQQRPMQYMPDIILTLPTPAETGSGPRREGYFAM